MSWRDWIAGSAAKPTIRDILASGAFCMIVRTEGVYYVSGYTRETDRVYGPNKPFATYGTALAHATACAAAFGGTVIADVFDGDGVAS